VTEIPRKNNVIDYGNNEFHYIWSMSAGIAAVGKESDPIYREKCL
jgi:hypothetical protein